MSKIVRCILFGLVALLFCWVPVAMAFFDALSGKGALRECLSREWRRWMEVLDEAVA